MGALLLAHSDFVTVTWSDFWRRNDITISGSETQHHFKFMFLEFLVGCLSQMLTEFTTGGCLIRREQHATVRSSTIGLMLK